MKERKRPSNEWYRKRIEQTGDLEFRTGPVSDVETLQRAQSALAVAFGVLVRLERKNKNLSVAELAHRLQVDEDEIRNIEHDKNYRARPRTIVNFARLFELPIPKVMALAGATLSYDSRFTSVVQRFAAYSDDLGRLSNDERRTLNEFVEFLKHKG